MKQVDTAVRPYVVFWFKKWETLYACFYKIKVVYLRISTRLDLKNNKAPNTWLKFLISHRCAQSVIVN